MKEAADVPDEGRRFRIAVPGDVVDPAEIVDGISPGALNRLDQFAQHGAVFAVLADDVPQCGVDQTTAAIA